MRDDEEIETRDLLDQTEILMSSNTHLPLINKIKSFHLNTNDAYFYLYLVWKNLSGDEGVDMARTASLIFERSSEKVHYMQTFLAGSNPLINKELAKSEKNNFFNDLEIRLSDKSHVILKECGIKLFENIKKRDNIIQPENIQPRKLIFNTDEMHQLVLLKKLLQENNLSETQNRLKNKNLPKGITILLHGSPGTGKTESVLQLAKETGRKIMKVDISQSKSAWFGESEKIVKRIFTGYKSFAGECKRVPILFFNEADAIFSKRKDSGNSNVGQTENAIQNILLEELENFEGILMATTNLTSNLDAAFERRFLFKVEFRNPGISTKKEIWKLKVPTLSLSDCETLAARFDFSGGQIDNIVRKMEIREILDGAKTGIDSLLKFCKEETTVNKVVEIGFLTR
jgi:SpoVK/Ycf46/Vps4 family AAA+-type ATPase